MKRNRFGMKILCAGIMLTTCLCIGMDSFATEVDEYAAGYIDTGERFDAYKPVEGTPQLLRESNIPAQYSLVELGQISSVKNQKNHGTCWAFSTAGAAENYMIRNGGMGNPDYSEYQMAYFFYHHVDDKLGNLQGDSTSILSSKYNYLTLGGNNTWTAFSLANWQGMVEEVKAPYEKASASSSLNDSLAYDDALHMQNVYFLSMKDKDEIKKMIMERGAVVSAMYVAPANSYYYFNTQKDASYQDVSKSANHSILIVGWDDDYAVENFKSGKQPSKKGAWLIKNSWGPDSAPYIWISYEDLCLSQQNAYSYEFESADNYDNNYQYDGCFGTAYLTVKNGYSIVNDFVAKASVLEEIKAVSFALKSTNVGYEIQVYRNSPEDDPMGGEPMLNEPVRGETTYGGYYTVPFEQPINVAMGDHFSVVITLKSLDGDEGVSCYVDADQEVSGLVKFDSTIKDNQSYVVVSSGDALKGKVIDLYEQYTSDYCFRIKAFTNSLGDGQIIDMADVKVSSISKKEYTGLKIKPCPSVTYKGITLVKDRDYTLSYSDNKNPGTATVTIKGIGNFSGSKTKTFQIVGKLSPVTTYNGVNYSAVYDYNYYVTKYEDVWNAYKNDDASVLRHFVEVGMKEGRRGKSSFSVKSYAYQYYDLRKLYKNDLPKYYLHYISSGKKEGRIATGTTRMKGGPYVYNNVNYKAVFNVGYYANRYPDLQKKYGLDDDKYLKHFVQTGMKKARKGNSEFNVKHYKDRYADLRKLYGEEYKKYYIHYITYGKAEGRNGK